MASTSASSIQKSFKYDVFLSFRGEDTRKNFVDHLYHALTQKGIYTYRDDEEIKKGERISDELIRSIEDSKFYIIVFSKNYASSSWCLEELVKIMECQETNEHTAYPVFYDVEPTEVRKQIGAVEEAFSKHKEKEGAGKWRDALREAADLAGWELKNTFDGHEAKLIQKIVEEISLELRFINSSVDEKLVGMETRVRDVISSLETNVEDVRMIGIWGMGGAGKTTLARVVFDQISYMFEGSSFVENVRECSKNPLCGLKSLQKQVLSDVLNKQDITINGVYEGKNMMKQRMCSRKVLVVLDDVDHIDQLQALAGELGWFKPGSRIIITTREEQVLVAHRVPKHLILDVNLLSHKEATCLFNRYAFGREIPTQGYEILSGQVVRYAAGLPLTIKVLGSFLCGKDELEYTDALERLKTIPLKETLEILELSYYNLEEDYKEIFLDVACILKGWEKERAIRVLESSGFHARNGLRVLEQKSLITISKYEHLGMHDHIEEMGRSIVRRLHPNEPRRHSRLWIKEEIDDILAKNLGTEATRCVNMWYTTCNLATVIRGLGSMKNLQVLNMCGISYMTFNTVSWHFPNALRYISWQFYPFRSLPGTFQADNLVGINMPSSKITQLWKGGERKALYKLRFLDLSGSQCITFNLEMTPNLDMLNLEGCNCLVKLDMPFECPKLKYLSLDGSNLRTLDLGPTPAIERLSLSECRNLKKLYMPFECSKLKSLSLNGTKLRTLNLGLTPGLEILNLSECCNFVKLYMPSECPKLKSLSLNGSMLKTLDLGSTPSLEMLSLSGCCNLVELHMPFGCPKLKSLNLNNSKLRTIDLKLSSNLEALSLAGCCKLVEICMPEEFPKLRSLILNRTKLRNLSLPQTPNLETLSLEECFDLVELQMLSGCLNLERLDLKDCMNLVELHVPVGHLKKLVYMNLSGCGSFKSFVFNKQLQSLEDGSLSELHLIAEPIDITCPLHPENNLPKLRFTCLYEDHLLSSVGNLENLISMGFSFCTNRESFSTSICSLRYITKLTLEGSIPEVLKDLYQLECLKKLTLLALDIKNLPDNISMLKQLKSLELDSCRLLEKLPESLGLLECIEELILRDCILLRDIPNSICKIRRLKYICLINCKSVDKLPEGIGCLECLEELNIEGTNISRLPQSIFGLEGLCIVGSRWLLESWGFTSEIQTLESEHQRFCYIVLMR